ncbi:LOW QUALITY PROTEIN: centrosomal protein of 95 kDa-like [Melanotaenia boesemani]|uniref:LOW QUALITY PROTEIN: centrosomal protein of 95 kDa-like n=1 Tax=Melanotaenia boesemani TaxID=1250792 RepID=UPI001C0495D8|nr:LOW QUALITY PROTEIN: centrosomal protein of 95 kDa-like [Melanotaenia boesemani]
MGTQEGERNWVDVANDILNKCHINLRLRKLTDCNADVFISLNENIFGEKVPDYIAAPCSQEDDVHNVQSVIDSLSLDYLQISLSHITGENVVRGDKEFYKNILEIFDGLLEYLNEEIEESHLSQFAVPPSESTVLFLFSEEFSDTLNEDNPTEIKRPTIIDVVEQKGTSMSSSICCPVPITQSLQSLNAEEEESASELIGLGVSARTFTDRQEGITPSGPVDTTEPPQTEQKHSAIPLQPPNQCNTPIGPNVDTQSPSCLPTAAGLSQGLAEDTTPVTTKSSQLVAEVVINGIQSPAPCPSPVVSEKSVSSQQRGRAEMEGETLEPTNGGPRRVLFRTQPDVLFLTLQDELITTTPSPSDTEEDEEEMSCTQRFKDRTGHRDGMSLGSRTAEEVFEEPLSYRRQRNKQAEEELHHISEKLSHRLEELDKMLKRVLEESGESSEVREEDKQSHHSDSLMERRQTPRQQTVSRTADPEPTQRTRSLSPSPPRGRCSLRGQSEEAMAEALSLDDGRQTNLTVSDHSRRELRHRPSHKRNGKYQENKAYEEELRRFEDKEQTELHKARLQAQKAEREYREAILQDVSQVPKLSPAKTKAQHRTHHSTQIGRQRRLELPSKAPPMKVKENDLLPVLRDELPHLHISPHALGRMWEQQMQQVDRLHALSSHRQCHSKLSSQVEEAQRKYDLLVELIRKDHDHSKRLRDFKDRIQQQKSVQNRLREQRQQIARAKKYHNDYHVQHRARLMRARTKEERMFRQLFEEGLELQKARLREQRAFAREQRLEHQRRHQDQIESMENYYKDQFSLLAEKLAQEREDIQVRKKAQEKALLKMKRELRSRMEREIGELQRIIIQNDEDDHFQDLEVQRLRNRVHMASFQYSTSHLH